MKKHKINEKKTKNISLWITQKPTKPPSKGTIPLKVSWNKLKVNNYVHNVNFGLNYIQACVKIMYEA